MTHKRKPVTDLTQDERALVMACKPSCPESSMHGRLRFKDHLIFCNDCGWWKSDVPVPIYQEGVI